MRTASELKKGIIVKFENGVRVSDLTTQYNIANVVQNSEFLVTRKLWPEQSEILRDSSLMTLFSLTEVCPLE